MGHRNWLRFLAVVLTAIAMVPGLAHLFSFSSKMALSGADYFIAQRAYDGWALLGIVMVTAIAAVVGLAAVMHHQPGQRWAWASAAAMTIGLGVFFGWVFPANRATSNWTIQPDNWAALRSQWETGRAINAVLYALAFGLVVRAILPRLD